MLSERERAILRLIADGWANRQIAEHLFLSLDTIKWYNKRIYTTLEVRNRTEAVKKAREQGLLETTASEPAPSPEPTPSHPLPVSTTPFVGRQNERGELANLLADADTRLITILAPGGMGKTRLALEVAHTQMASFAEGVFFVSLTAVHTADDFLPSLATSLNIPLGASSDPAQQVHTFLRHKTALLVLDNFEHLVDGANHVATLLQASRHLKVITTSRERLNLRGEIVYALGGMALPTGHSLAETRTCSAVQLFMQGAQRVQPNLTFADKDWRFVRDICLRVGGMPLGIQLAASLMEVLSPHDIAHEIERSLDILATDMRDVPLRLRSIRAVFESSWSRLSQAEQEVYMRLSVFRAGFTREAAQTMAGAHVLLLKALVNKSLVQWDPDTPRYTLHELLRQYAEEQLHTSGLADSAYEAHGAFYLDLLTQCGRGIKGHQQLEALNRIEADFDNIRAAWSQAIAQNNREAINHALEPLYWYCRMRARVPVGETLLQQARNQWGTSFSTDAHPIQRRLLLQFEKAGETYHATLEHMVAVVRTLDASEELAFFLWLLGMNRYLSSDFERAVVVLEEAVARFQALNDDFYRAEGMHWLSFLGQVEEVRVLSRDVRALCRSTGNQFALARVLGRQGIYAVLEDDPEQARSDLHEAIALRKALGDRAGMAVSVAGLGLDAFFEGNFSEARVRAEESHALAEEHNSLYPRAIARSIVGWLAAVEEDYQQAWDLCQESLTTFSDPNVDFLAQFGLAMAACGLENYAVAQEKVHVFFSSSSPLHTPKGYLSYLPVLAMVYASQHQHQRATEVLALAFTHPQSPTGWMAQWKLLDRWRETLNATLGNEPYEFAWKRGTTLDLEHLVAAVRDIHQP